MFYLRYCERLYHLLFKRLLNVSMRVHLIRKGDILHSGDAFESPMTVHMNIRMDGKESDRKNNELKARIFI